MRDAFLSALPENAVIVEAGAYHGEDTSWLAAGCSTVHAFEPISFEILHRNVEHLENVVCWRSALGAETGFRDMWVSGGPHTAASSLLEPKEHLNILPEITFNTRARVWVETIADWSKRNYIPCIDGMWLDMQGAELAALKAAGPILDTVHAMVLEVSSVELYEGCPLWIEANKWLREQGFSLILEEPQGHKQANILVAR